MGANFVLIPRVFVDVRGNQDRKPLLACRQRNRTPHLCARALAVSTISWVDTSIKR